DGVPVAGDASDHPVEQVTVAGLVERPEPDLVPEGHRSGTHGEDIPEDAADTGGCALVRLHERRVVVALDADGGEPAVADVDDTGVLTGADHHPGRLGGEAAEVGPGRPVGAVLRPHHRVHGQLGGPGLAAEDLDDLQVLLLRHAQLGVDGSPGRGHALTGWREQTNPSSRTRPSSEPRRESVARSGWGMMPTTLPAALATAAARSWDPLGSSR